jgi:hypothetical protein
MVDFFLRELVDYTSTPGATHRINIGLYACRDEVAAARAFGKCMSLFPPDDGNHTSTKASPGLACAYNPRSIYHRIHHSVHRRRANLIQLTSAAERLPTQITDPPFVTA